MNTPITAGLGFGKTISSMKAALDAAEAAGYETAPVRPAPLTPERLALIAHNTKAAEECGDKFLAPHVRELLAEVERLRGDRAPAGPMGAERAAAVLAGALSPLMGGRIVVNPQTYHGVRVRPWMRGMPSEPTVADFVLYAVVEQVPDFDGPRVCYRGFWAEVRNPDGTLAPMGEWHDFEVDAHGTVHKFAVHYPGPVPGPYAVEFR